MSDKAVRRLGPPPGGWTTEAMRQTIEEVRLDHPDADTATGAPIEMFLAEMLEQVLDELVLGEIEHGQDR